MKYLLSILFVLPAMLQAQQNIESSSQDSIYQIAEQMPEFPGGINEMYKYIGENLVYPREARDNGVEGIVYAKFIVYKDGSIHNVEILRGIGAGCDEEVVRVLKNMPNWSPGISNGEYVNVYYKIPVKFELSNGRVKKHKKKKDEE